MALLEADITSSAPWWFDAAIKLGLPSLMLFVICAALWRIAKPLLLRVVDSHIKVLDGTLESQQRIEEMLRRLVDLAEDRKRR